MPNRSSEAGRPRAMPIHKTPDLKRIKVRALRRIGQLLKQIDAKVANQHTVPSASTDTEQGRTAAAEKAGMSKRQINSANCLANMPSADLPNLRQD